MIIKQLEKSDRVLYEKHAREYGTIFVTLGWLSMFGDKVQLYGIYNKGNELIGGFFIYKEKKFGLSVYRNPPFTPEIGPFLKVDAKNPVSIMDTWKKTLTLMADVIGNLPYSIATFSFNENIIDMQPFVWKQFKVVPEFTYLLDLNESIEYIWGRMSNERRKNINKGIKDGLVVKQIDDFNIIRSLVIKTFSKKNKGVNEFYLDKILFEFANENNSFAFATFKDSNPIACSFCIYDKHTAYYFLGGYDHENKHHGAGASSMWEAIKCARELGLKCFDFEGSMEPQIERYFRGFGGQLTPYYRINKALLPVEIVLKFIKRELF